MILPSKIVKDWDLTYEYLRMTEYSEHMGYPKIQVVIGKASMGGFSPWQFRAPCMYDMEVEWGCPKRIQN